MDLLIAVVPNGDREIPAEGVLKLYRAEGWWPERTAEQVCAVLRAAPAVGAWHGQELIGFAWAVTDGILRAYVEDVIVSRTGAEWGSRRRCWLA